MRQILSVFAGLLFVASCGGGGGDSETVQINPDLVDSVEEVPMCSELVDDRGAIRLDLLCNEDGSIKEEEIQTSPSNPDGYITYRCIDSKGRSIGSSTNRDIVEGICANGLNPLILIEPEESERTIPLGQPGFFDWDECLHTDKLVTFFDSIFKSQSQIERFNSRPMLSLAEGTTDFQADIVRRALEFINYSLPEEYRVSLENTRVPALSGEPPNSEIYVDFASRDQWKDIGDTYFDGIIGAARYYSSFNKDNPELSRRSAHIWIDPQYIQIRTLDGDFYKDLRDTANIGLLAHEILHALGLSGHVPAERVGGITFSGVSTIMWPTVSAVGHSTITEETRILTGALNVSFGLLNPADRAGLRYLYEKLETGDNPRNITEADLDAWLTEKGCFSQ